MKFFLSLMLICFGSQAFSIEEFPGEGSNFIALQDVIIPSSVSETDVFYRKLSNSPGTYYGEQGCMLNVVPSSKVRRIPKDFKIKIKSSSTVVNRCNSSEMEVILDNASLKSMYCYYTRVGDTCYKPVITPQSLEIFLEDVFSIEYAVPDDIGN